MYLFVEENATNCSDNEICTASLLPSAGKSKQYVSSVFKNKEFYKKANLS